MTTGPYSTDSIIEAKLERHKVEERIMQMLVDFTKQTGIVVYDIDVYPSNIMGDNKFIKYFVELEARL